MKKILMVDDDPDITMLVKMKLEKTGRFEVAFTNEGKKALEMAKAHGPDLILSDLDMPDKFGGDVARDLAEDPETKDIPILFCSSLVRPEDIRDGQVGGRRMVSKSSPPEVLIGEIDKILS